MPSDMTSFPVKGSAFSSVTKNPAVAAGRDLFPGNSRNWSERWNFFSLNRYPEGIRSTLVCGFQLLNRKENEAGTGQVTSTSSLRYPRISPETQKVKLLVDWDFLKLFKVEGFSVLIHMNTVLGQWSENWCCSTKEHRTEHGEFLPGAVIYLPLSVKWVFLLELSL